MNNSEFVKWVKSLTAGDVAGAGLKNPAVFKTVCLVLATYGDYATGTGVQPAWTTVAKESCVSRTTAHKVRDFLVTKGVLVETGKTAPSKDTAGNITIYRFNAVDHLTWTTEKDDSCLSRDPQLSIQEPQLSIAEPQLSTLGGHNTTLDTTKNTKEDTTTDSDEPVETTNPSNLSFAENVGAVAPTTGPVGPVDSSKENIKSTVPTKSSLPKEITESSLSSLARGSRTAPVGAEPIEHHRVFLMWNKKDKEEYLRICKAHGAVEQQIIDAAELKNSHTIKGCYSWYEEIDVALNKVGVDTGDW